MSAARHIPADQPGVEPTADRWWEPTDEELAEQRAARNAIMEIPLFPDLTVALRGALGYGPHVDMLQHFCYWMHPRHPKMQSRWTMYKTYAEWRDECGLTDRQIKKGRKVLRDLGVVAEKKGPHGRVHYRVDWVALTWALSLDAITDQTDEGGDESSLDGTTDQGQVGRHGVQGSLDAITDQANTGDYPGDYFRKSSLQKGGDGSESRTAPTEEEREQIQEGKATPTDIDASQRDATQLQEQSPKGDVDDASTDNAAGPIIVDAACVARASSALDATLAEWPGYINDVDAGEWRKLAMTMEQLKFADERFTPVEVMLAARGLAQSERVETAAYG